MRSSRVVLTRGKQEIILRGMIHIGPLKFYEEINREIYEAVRNGHLILYEGIGTWPTIPLTKNGKQIIKLLWRYFRICSAFAEVVDLKTQGQLIQYPLNAVRADVSLDELADLLDKNGFRCDLLFYLSKQIAFRKKIKNKLRKKFIKQGLIHPVIDGLATGRRAADGSNLWRKAIPIVLNYRNKYAVATIEQYDGYNIYLNYGQSHIRGLVKLLKQNGWTVKERQYLDMAKLYL